MGKSKKPHAKPHAETKNHLRKTQVIRTYSISS